MGVAWEGLADLCTRVRRPIAGSILTIISKPLALSPAGGGFALPMCEQAIARRSKGDCEVVARPCVALFAPLSCARRAPAAASLRGRCQGNARTIDRAVCRRRG